MSNAMPDLNQFVVVRILQLSQFCGELARRYN